MKHKIDWLEARVVLGQNTLDCSLEGQEGKVTIWEKDKQGVVFPNFVSLKPGDEVEGDIVTNTKGFKTLYPPRTNPMGVRPAWAKKESGIAKAQEVKREDIKAAQENKHEAIKMAGAMRDSTLITLAELAGSPLVAEDFKLRWSDWRKWLMDKANEPFA